MLALIEILIIILNLLGIALITYQELKTGKGISVEEICYVVLFSILSFIPIINLIILWFVVKFSIIDEYGTKRLFKNKK